MSNIIQFKEMIKELKSEVLSEICEQFLFDHEEAMRVLSECCRNFGIYIDDSGLHSFYKDFNDTKSYKEGKWVYEGCDMTVVKEGDLTELEMDQMVKIVSVKNVKCEDECESSTQNDSVEHGVA